jgi:hypothetical protein
MQKVIGCDAKKYVRFWKVSKLHLNLLENNTYGRNKTMNDHSFNNSPEVKKIFNLPC